MSDEIVDAILKYLDSHLSTERRFSVSWYGGEPLLCLNKIEKITQGILDICSKKNIKYEAAIITNGYLFTEDVAKKLADLKVRSVQITLDGPEEVHDSRRPLKSGKGTYSVIVENIARASNVYPYRISIRVNIDKRNISSISEMLHNLKQRGFHLKKNVLLHFAPVTAATLGCQDCAAHCFNPKMFSKLELKLYEKALDLGFKTVRYPMVNLGICGAVSSNSFVVEPSGALHKCWNTIGDSSKEVGHILQPNEELTPNLIKWLVWDPFDREECKKCAVLPICMGGCPFKALYPREIAPESKERCMSWKYNLEESLRQYKKAKELGLVLNLPESGGKDSPCDERG